MATRCRNCGEPMEQRQPDIVEQARFAEALNEYRSRFGHLPPNALGHLAESRGLPLSTVVEYAAADRLAEVVRLPQRRTGGRR